MRADGTGPTRIDTTSSLTDELCQVPDGRCGARDAGPLRCQHAKPTVAACILLALSVLTFVGAQIALWPQNGYWIDEYFSLWASEPTLSLRTLLDERILTDTNPPLYFLLLALARLVPAEPRVTFLALNVVALVLACTFVILSSRQSELSLAAVVACALFAASGPVLCYAPEGRAYLVAMCITFATAWTAATAAERHGAATLALLGAGAALAHVFAVILALAIAAGLLIEAALSRRRRLVRAGLALGGASGTLFAAWLPLALEHKANLSWIEFSAASVLRAAGYVNQLAFGHTLVAVAVLAFLACSARHSEARPPLRIFGIALVLFVMMPLLASFHTPVVHGRYWLVGAPMIPVLAALTLRCELARASWTTWAGRSALAAATLGSVIFAAAAAGGFAQALAFTASKPIWRGAGLAASRVRGCGKGTVHVWHGEGNYAMASGAPVSTFIDATRPETPLLDPRNAACPVLGWAEHVYLGGKKLGEVSDEGLLALLKIGTARVCNVQVLRHSSGFIILSGDDNVTPP